MSDFPDINAEQDSLDAVSTDPNTGKAPAVTSGTPVEPPEVTEAEKAAVKEWTQKIKDAKVFHKKAFDRMRECQRIANEGRDKDWPENNYTVPVLGRHINVSVSALYARNPTATAKRKKKVQFQLWDGNFASLQQAMQAAQPPVDPATGQPVMDPMTGQPAQGDPNAMALLMEVQQVHQQNVLMDRAAKTLEILFEYYMNEQDAGYKQQLKAAVRRTKVCYISWVKLGFQRIMQPNPDVTSKIADATSQLATLKVLAQDLAAKEFDENSAKMDELRNLLADLQSRPNLIVREGPVLGFPKSRQVIVDPDCVHLKTLAGANWVAQEFPPMSRDAIKETFGVDIGTNFKAYESTDKSQPDAQKQQNLAIVWEVQNKKTQEVFTICEGYPSYLKRPAAPDVKVSRFWTLFPIIFNEIEDDEQIYGYSDVWAARHMQREYNTVRQSLREHRIQNRPKYATIKGKLEDEDLKKLSGGASGDIIEINGMGTGEKVEDVLQQIKTVPIDPNLYEVSSIFSDIERAIGSSQADLGAPASVTATQSSIIEQGRSATNSDNVDDLDDVLSELARSMGELMLLELDHDTVVKIAGPGAVWPQTPPSRQQIAEDLWLEVKAGSSGRPNRAAELANMERGLPYLIQIPGVNPFPLGRRYGELLELDVDDIVIEGMPSILAQNAAAGRDPFSANPQGGLPANAHGQAGAGQGPAGATNAPNPQHNEPGPQPGYTAPAQHAAAGGAGLVAPGVLGNQNAPIPAPRYKAEQIKLGPQPGSA